MKRVIPAAAFCLVIATVAIFAQDPETELRKRDKLSAFMQLKLKHAQKVLEGLATEDLALVAKNSQAISLLSQEATWQVFQTAEYLEHSDAFRRTVNGLTKEANEKRLDGAALRYLEMTMKCLECHKYVRGVRVAQIEPRLPGGE